MIPTGSGAAPRRSRTTSAIRWRLRSSPHRREPITNDHAVPLIRPSGFLRWVVWNLFGRKFELKADVTEPWQVIDTILQNCPLCNGPLATTDKHTIGKLNPLTIHTPITCPYCCAFTSKIAENNIVLA